MAEVDRLSELLGDSSIEDKETTTVEETKPHESSKEIQEHMKLYEPIRKGLQTIKENVEKINKLKQEDRLEVQAGKRQELLSQLDTIMAQTTDTGKKIKGRLEEIKKQNAKYASEHKDSAKMQVRDNLYQTNLRKFHQTMNEYNAASHDFKQALQERVRRQLKIVVNTGSKTDMTDEEIEKIVESGQANEVIGAALVSDNLREAVRDIEERHLGILKLEKQVLEVYELFKDLATLVEVQQESLDVIENRINHARDYAVEAEKELVSAETYQKKSRRLQCCLLLIVLAVLVAVLAPILATQLKKS